MADEAMVIVGQTQEAAQFLDRGRSWPLQDCLDLVRISGHALFRNQMAQIAQLSLSKDTLGEVNLPFVLLQQFQHKAYMFNVFFQSPTEYQDIVKEYQHALAQ